MCYSHARRTRRSRSEIMIAIDAHLDLAWNALNWGRDLTLPVSEIRKAETSMKQAGRGANTVAFPEMRHGEVVVCVATLLAPSSGMAEPTLDYGSPSIAAARPHDQLDY